MVPVAPPEVVWFMLLVGTPPVPVVRVGMLAVVEPAPVVEPVAEPEPVEDPVAEPEPVPVESFLHCSAAMD